MDRVKVEEFADNGATFSANGRSVRCGISGYVGRFWECSPNDGKHKFGFGRSTAEGWLNGYGLTLGDSAWLSGSKDGSRYTYDPLPTTSSDSTEGPQGEDANG